MICTCVWASQATPSRLYQITIETGMPHLEENLRYAITREKRCLTREEIFRVFPILGHQALQGCRLGDERRQENTSSWTLLCDGTHGTTGRAMWFLGAKQISGTLHVKLGGKNMTFYQRAILKPLGECTGA